MRKLTVLAMLAAVLMAGSAFGIQRLQPNASFVFGVGGAAFGPTTTNNDDTCDIGTAPAATLLLPFFEVDFRASQATAKTTLFTITNVTNLPQIAHIVIWTDWSFPAIDFNIFLTGFDVQGINLFDIFSRGVIAPPTGTSSTTTVPTNPSPGSQPAANDANPNINSLAGCTNLPGAIPPGLLTDLQAIFTTGVGTGVGIPCTTRVGGTHANAIGYVTIDVNANCNTSLPNTAAYFTTNILFDNVLIGDFQDVNPNPATGNFAGGGPLVHIRAIPEGGFVGSNPTVAPGGPTNLPFTFYDRYTAGAPDRRFDRRQPLPSTFAARFISGGTGQFNSNFKIWREGINIGACATGATGAIQNSSLAVTELVKFDEHENANIVGGGIVISPAPLGQGLPETSSTPVSGAFFPLLPSAAGDVAGWVFLNLNHQTVTNLTRNNVAATVANRPSQNWVIVHMEAEGRFSVDFDAAWLGNGCSAPVASGAVIGPAGGILVCPPPLVRGVTCATTPVGTNATP
jgi:hypothetical protein